MLRNKRSIEKALCIFQFGNKLFAKDVNSSNNNNNNNNEFKVRFGVLGRHRGPLLAVRQP